MIAYYEFTEAVYNHLISDDDVNSVVIGDISEVNFNKQEIFPFAHILIGSATILSGFIRFSVTVSVMDIVDITKGDIREQLEPFKGIDNKQDVLNTMMAVIENLDKAIRNDNLGYSGYELIDDITAEPFEDRFNNLVTGWSATFTVDVPNRKQKCG
jgi:hypothetical protein